MIIKFKLLFIEEELLKYDGFNFSILIYILIFGWVYDVDKGRRYYEVGSGYNVFVGCDLMLLFVIGVFLREKVIDDVKGLFLEEMLGIKEWLDFYRKDYIFVGKLIGCYYDSEGNFIEVLIEVKVVIKEG